MEHSVKYQFFMSQITPIEDIKETDKTKISIVYHQGNSTSCILRICKGRDLSPVCAALRDLRHPNAVVVYDYVYENGDTYILEENISGSNVDELLEQNGVFSPRETARIALEVCHALEKLHRLSPPVIHNDITPANIRIRDDGAVKLFDFDISRTFKKEQTQNTQLFGTAEYASPEHYGYGQSEPRTDIYGLGATMHKMLTNQGLSADHRVTYQGPLKAVLQKCLEVDPKNRYASVSELKKDLEKFLNHKRSSKGLLAWFLVVVLISFGYFMLTEDANEEGAFAPEDTTTSAQPQIDNTTDTPSIDPTDTPSTTNTTAPSLPDTTTAPTATDNHTKENARVLELNQTYEETIESPEQANWYQFTTDNQAAIYRIAVYCDQGPHCVTLSLYDASMLKVDELEIYPSQEQDKVLDLCLAANARYKIKVESPRAADYLLCVWQQPRDAGIDRESATPVALGERKTCRLDTMLSDWFVFTVPKDGSYAFTMMNVGVDPEVKYRCYRNDEHSLIAAGNAAIEDVNNNSFSAKQGDRVYIQVRTNNKSASGEYFFQIEERQS